MLCEGRPVVSRFGDDSVLRPGRVEVPCDGWFGVEDKGREVAPVLLP